MRIDNEYLKSAIASGQQWMIYDAYSVRNSDMVDKAAAGC